MRAMSIDAFLSAVFVVTPVIADAQTKVLPAAAISAAEIQALMGPRKPNALPNIRVVDAGGHNVGVGVLYRADPHRGLSRQRRFQQRFRRLGDMIFVHRELQQGNTSNVR